MIDSPGELRYLLLVGNRQAGVLRYGRKDGRLVLHHTEVDQSVEGHGLGSRLVAGVLDDVRARGLEIVPLCPFVRKYLERHPEHADLVAGSGAR